MKIHFILIFHLFNFSYEIELKLRYLKKKKENSLGIKEKISILIIIIIILFLVIIYLIVKKNRIKKKKDNEITRVKIEYLFKNNLKQKIIKLKFPNLLYNECSICLENIKENDKVSYTPCKHIFHFDCLKNYIKSTLKTNCPLCKFDFFSLLTNENIDFSLITFQENSNNQLEEIYIDNCPSYNNSHDNKIKENNFENNLDNNVINFMTLNDENTNMNKSSDLNKEIFFPMIIKNNKKENNNKFPYENEDIISNSIFIKKKENNDDENNITKLKIIYNGILSNSNSKQHIFITKKNNSIKEENDNNNEDEKDKSKKSDDSFESVKYKTINLKTFNNGKI